MKPYSFFAATVTTYRFCAVVAVLLLVALSSAPGQTLTSWVGPGVFVDSLGSFSLFIPEGFAVNYDPTTSDTSSSHVGWVSSLANDGSYPVGFRVTTFEQVFKPRPELRPQFAAGADTIKEMLLACLRVGLPVPTSASTADTKIDLITEERTDSGLRVFVVRVTRFVRNSPSEAGDSITLGPWRYVAIPNAGDCIFVKFHSFADPPPSRILKLQQGLAKSVRTWRK
jgi:hypothetical protein